MHDVVHPDGWKPARGYANAIMADGHLVFLGGQIGWTADQTFETDDFVGQMEQTLRNVRTVLEEAGGRSEHLVRLTWLVTDKRSYLSNLKSIGTVYRNILGRRFPAMTVVEVNAMMEDQAKVEIETTAVLPRKQERVYPSHDHA